MDASTRIDNYISGTTGWRGETIDRLRKLVLKAAPGLAEEWKWNSPVWSQGGLVLSIGAFKKHVGINFFQGASLEDSHGLFNSGLEAKASRTINLYPGDKINESAFQELVRAAVAYNLAK